MIPVDVLNSLKALALNQKPLVIATPPAASAGPAFEAGQKYQAIVQAQVAPGIFKVQVAEQVLQMQLPASLRSGEKITLQVVSLLPRLTFTMAASANPLATPDQLSSTARLLSSLAQQPLEKSYVRPMQSAPLWAGATQLPDTAELADKLHESLSQSGLFYEAHQMQWLQGSRSTSELMHEPQNLPAALVKNALARDGNPASRVANPASRVDNPASRVEDSINRVENPANRVDNAVSRLYNSVSRVDNTSIQQASSQTSSGTSSGIERNSIPSIPEHLQPLVQQQLNVLETRQVQWQGQVWPNQEMKWEIHEESARKPNGEEERQWATQVQLDLPNLGEVTAKLRFSSTGLSLTLDAADSETRAKLGNSSSILIAALTERGISTSSSLVAKHDDT